MKKLFLIAGLAGSITGLAYSQAVPIDTFESYADNAALSAVWTDQVPGTTLQTTSGDGANGSNKFVRLTAAADRRYYSGTLSLTPTDTSLATLDYWYRQPLGATLNREYCNVNSSLLGADIVAIGNYNSATGTEFFGRVNGGGGPSWGKIGGTRLDNTWQHLQAQIGTRDVKFYVDGVQTGTQSRTTTDHPAYTALFIGSNLSSASTVDVDNVGFIAGSGVSDWDVY